MLTDKELREELKKLGVNVGPITNTTRKLYTKRLEKLRSENDKKESETLQDVKRMVGRHVAMPPKRSTKTSVRSVRRRSTIGYSTDESEDDKTKETESIRSTRQSTRNSFATSREIEVKSHTPVHKRVKDLTHTPRSSSRSSRKSGSFGSLEQYSDDSDASENSVDWVETHSMETNTTPSLKMNTNESPRYRYGSRNAGYQNNDVNDTGTSSPLGRRNLRSHDFHFPAHDEDESTRKKKIGNGNSRSNDRYSDPDPDEIVQSVSEDVLSSNKVKNVVKRPWTLNFSSFLPIGTVIFFLVLGLLYITMKHDSSLISQDLLDFDTAEKDIELASRIYDYAGIIAGERICEESPSQGYIPVSQMTEDLQLKDEETLSKTLRKIIEKSEWGIAVYDGNEERLEEAESHINAKYIYSEQPIMSGWCRFTRALQKVLFRALIALAAGILFWFGLVYRRYRIEKQKEEREQMFVMVQKIQDVLMKQYEMSEKNSSIQPYLPILHVRDMILAPRERKKMEKIWEKAKRFLSASETRIRVETQRILGEDYLVWRWIQAASPEKRYTDTSRTWLGQAFDISKSVNRPMICPAPCLKIRNLFDVDMEYSKDWVTQIQDSILEKCQGNNEILRICVEKDSKEGIVYMLCASNQGAGRAFQALHGAWFDGRLVTVKFIKLHRFHLRFPDSVNQPNVPMRPTSAVPVSTILSSPTAGDDPPQTYKRLYPTLPDD